MKRITRKPPEQTPFIIILAGQGRRYRNVILAYDLDDAGEKAAQIAATLTGNFEVLAVRRAEAKMPMGKAQPGPEARGANAALGRGSAKAA